jgi:hypothetical protein
MFPPRILDIIVVATNAELERKHIEKTTNGEV